MASLSRQVLGESSMVLRSTIRRACVLQSQHRHLATIAATDGVASSEASASTGTPAKDRVGAYFLLSRLPRILSQPSPFEAAFYAYNTKVQRILSMPFPHDLYFKRGSAGETQFLKEDEQRKTAMKIWGTEESLSSASVVDVQGDATSIRPRVTKADETNDVRSLERSSDKTLFLVVRGGQAGPTWTLPRTNVLKQGQDSLRDAVNVSLESMLGKSMDIWMLTNLPVGVVGKASDGSIDGFVMRAHITAGNAKPTSKEIDFAWLTREELEKELQAPLWTDVKDLLTA